jgi:nucleotide-binding universal stress UspA family protein
MAVLASITSLDQLDADVADAMGGATTVLVPVDDGNDAARERTRLVAQQLAALVGARLVLLDRTDTTYADTPRVQELTREQADDLGRPYLVRQIDEAADAGVEVIAFEHSLPGSEALTDAAKETSASVIVVPHHLDKPGFLDHFRKGDAADRAGRAAPDGVSVLAVEADGTISRIC